MGKRFDLLNARKVLMPESKTNVRSFRYIRSQRGNMKKSWLPGGVTWPDEILIFSSALNFMANFEIIAVQHIQAVYKGE